jgi:hypothetical protein
MTNNIVSLIKTSSQAALVAVADIMYGATQIMVETFRNLEVMLLIWAIYVVIASLAVVAIRRIARIFRMPGYGRACHEQRTQGLRLRDGRRQRGAGGGAGPRLSR